MQHLLGLIWREYGESGQESVGGEYQAVVGWIIIVICKHCADALFIHIALVSLGEQLLCSDSVELFSRT